MVSQVLAWGICLGSNENPELKASVAQGSSHSCQQPAALLVNCAGYNGASRLC